MNHDSRTSKVSLDNVDTLQYKLVVQCTQNRYSIYASHMIDEPLH